MKSILGFKTPAHIPIRTGISRFKQEFTVETEASDLGLGAILTQDM